MHPSIFLNFFLGGFTSPLSSLPVVASLTPSSSEDFKELAACNFSLSLALSGEVIVFLDLAAGFVWMQPGFVITTYVVFVAVGALNLSKNENVFSVALLHRSHQFVQK